MILEWKRVDFKADESWGDSTNVKWKVYYNFKMNVMNEKI